ncbi:hypothetical protein [Pseudarthrobacter sp. IC2-21]|uniref:hypothetical protein n=1 Tax=Pseudarthrobacter sp. IC2-21 TaxID=3092262 RepID=UPI002A6B67BA|nr:hypothetical protein [Pseudarthrobacter sp. IC2-21]
MIISFDASLANREPLLIDPGNFRELKIVIANSTPATFAVSERNKELGRWDGDHVWVKPQELVRLASVANEPDSAWHEALSQMLTR